MNVYPIISLGLSLNILGSQSALLEGGESFTCLLVFKLQGSPGLPRGMGITMWYQKQSREIS